MATERYIKVNPSLVGPFFQFQNGTFLTRNSICRLLQSTFPTLNVNTHSFRIGGASAASSHGIPDSIIQVLGRWSSDCFRNYIRISDQDLEGYQELLATESSNIKLWQFDEL